MKISYEVPLCLLDYAKENFNDYEYALVHLFPDYPQYFNFFKKSNRMVILDNSLYELGETFNSDDYVKWIEKLEPTYYILPDIYNDYKKNIEGVFRFLDKYKLPFKTIAVIHGESYKEMCECYKVFDNDDRIDMIAISFGGDRVFRYMTRYELIMRMVKDGIINKNKKHHLLGVRRPQEVILYSNLSFIESIDTSNPIVAALENIRYTDDGLDFKPKRKMIDFFNIQKEDINFELLNYNVNKFKEFLNGGLNG